MHLNSGLRTWKALLEVPMDASNTSKPDIWC